MSMLDRMLGVSKAIEERKRKIHGWYIIHLSDGYLNNADKTIAGYKVMVSRDILFEGFTNKNLPRLRSLLEDWVICYDHGVPGYSPHLEIKASSKEEALKIVKESELYIKLYLGVIVPKGLTREKVLNFY